MLNNKRNFINFILTFSICFLCCNQVKSDSLTLSSYIILPNNSYIDANQYIINSQYKPSKFGIINGTLTINIAENNTNMTAFDAFLLTNFSDVSCFKLMIQNSGNNCDFLTNNPSVPYINFNVSSIQISFTNTNFFSQNQIVNDSIPNLYIILDNTQAGTSLSHMQDLYLLLTLEISLENLNNGYLNKSIQWGIVLGALLIFSIIVVIYVVYRYRKLLYQNKIYSMVSAGVTKPRNHNRMQELTEETKDNKDEFGGSPTKKYMQ